jgi:hypothetical protein
LWGLCFSYKHPSDGNRRVIQGAANGFASTPNRVGYFDHLPGVIPRFDDDTDVAKVDLQLIPFSLFR